MVLFVLGGMAALAFLLANLFGGDGQTAVFVWIGGLGLALALPVLAIGMAMRAFRGIATPLADVMSAADAVAQGDMTVRVEERGPGDFSQLARSFNRMVDELRRTDQQRRNLTADVAHELRNPVHIIQGNLEGIIDGVYEPTTEHVGAMLDETRHLARLVEDLRTLSLAESGQLALQTEEVDVRELFGDVQTGFSGQAEAAGVYLIVEALGGASPVVVEADLDRLHQVLNNLVVNALRHTPEGGSITLGARETGDVLQIVVQDTGEGIPADDLPYVFDRFWRGDRARSRSSDVGGGLGLPIARQLIEAHGGRIQVAGESGEGTTFTIELPRSSGAEG